MPIFEFICRKCSHPFEEIMTFAQLEAGEARCPECGSKRVERSMSAFATGGGSGGGGCSTGGCGSGGFT
jgi:putative FmdB family regulatory protein